MSNLFLHYLGKRLRADFSWLNEKPQQKQHYDQIITISRQSGCSAKELADLFNRVINKNIRRQEDQWKCIDKEIMLDSAKILDLPPRKIQYVFDAQKKSKMDEIFNSLSSRYYKNDKIIRKTIVEVMKKYAQKGNLIVVGRAGVALSQYVGHSLNIRLVAPLQWRVEQISRKHGVPEEEARRYITEIDEKRTALIEEFSGEKMEESMFDIIFNCQNISKEEIVQTSLSLMKNKGFIY